MTGQGRRSLESASIGPNLGRGLRFHQSEAHRVTHQCRSRMEIKLVHEPTSMALCGFGADAQAGCYLFGAHGIGHADDYVTLALSY